MDQTLPKSNTLPDQATEQAQAHVTVDQHLRHLEDLQDEPDQDQEDQQPRKNPSKSKPTKSKPAAFVTKLFGSVEKVHPLYTEEERMKQSQISSTLRLHLCSFFSSPSSSPHFSLSFCEPECWKNLQTMMSASSSNGLMMEPCSQS